MSDNWGGILDADEEVLWQGQPDPGVHIDWRKRSKPVFFLAFTAVSLFILLQLAREGGGSWIFVLPFVGIGLYHLVLVHYWEAYVRRHTHYTITSKRALIATEVMGRRSLKTYDLDEDNDLELEEHNGLADIYFAQKRRVYPGDRRDGIRGVRSSLRRIGFRYLPDGRKVYGILRQVIAQRSGGPA